MTTLKSLSAEVHRARLRSPSLNGTCMVCLRPTPDRSWLGDGLGRCAKCHESRITELSRERARREL